MAYIRLQLINGVGLISDNGAHKVANRNNSDKLASIENGKMTNPFLSHDFHTGFNRVIWN